jgi:hypothetical protein
MFHILDALLLEQGLGADAIATELTGIDSDGCH